MFKFTYFYIGIYSFIYIHTIYHTYTFDICFFASNKMIQVHTWLYMLGCWIMCDKSSAWSFCTCGTRKEMITHDNSVPVGLRYCRFQTGLKRTKRVATGDRILCCVTSWSWTMREKVFLLHPVGRSGLELQDHARPVVYSIPNPHRNHAVVQTLKVYQSLYSILKMISQRYFPIQ